MAFDIHQNLFTDFWELCKLFGVSQQSVTTKSARIWNVLDLFPMHTGWTLPEHMDSHPLMWQMIINGAIVDIRHAPRKLQEEVFNQGLIPYIPADKDKDE